MVGVFSMPPGAVSFRGLRARPSGALDGPGREMVSDGGTRPGERPARQAETTGGRGSPGDRRRRRIGDGRAVLRLARAAPRLRPGGAVRLRLRAVGRPQALPDTGALGPRRLPAQHLCPGGRYPLRGRAERADVALPGAPPGSATSARSRSEEHTSELQSPYDLVCRLLLEKKKKNIT